jgi:bacteriocin biosynthesis cyclodehydratase domain-containing protein
MLDGRELHIGPTVVPGSTACYRCYELRYKSNIPVLEAYLAFESKVRAGVAPVDFGLLPTLVPLVSDLLACDIARILDGQQAQSHGALLTINMQTLKLERHPVLKLPRCSACSPIHNAPPDRTWR